VKTLYVYILKCSDDSLYVGVTNDVGRRFNEHQSAIHPESYTAQRLPIQLLYVEPIVGPLKAIAREKQLKNWSNEKKMALINNDLELLTALSKKKFKK
jgi:putative endonuclease